MLPRRKARAKKRRKVIRVKGVDVKKAVIAGGVFWGIIGFIASLILAATAFQIPVVGVPIGIGTVVVITAISAALGAILTGLCGLILNLALETAKGFDIEADY